MRITRGLGILALTVVVSPGAMSCSFRSLGEGGQTHALVAGAAMVVELDCAQEVVLVGEGWHVAALDSAGGFWLQVPDDLGGLAVVNDVFVLDGLERLATHSSEPVRAVLAPSEGGMVLVGSSPASFFDLPALPPNYRRGWSDYGRQEASLNETSSLFEPAVIDGDDIWLRLDDDSTGEARVLMGRTEVSPDSGDGFSHTFPFTRASEYQGCPVVHTVYGVLSNDTVVRDGDSRMQLLDYDFGGGEWVGFSDYGEVVVHFVASDGVMSVNELEVLGEEKGSPWSTALGSVR